MKNKPHDNTHGHAKHGHGDQEDHGHHGPQESRAWKFIKGIGAGLLLLLIVFICHIFTWGS